MSFFLQQLLTCSSIHLSPCRIPPQCEYSARTIRGKINNLVPEYLVPFPNDGQVAPNDITHNSKGGNDVMADCAAVDWRGVLAGLTIDRTVGPVSWLTPGTAAGLQTLHQFLEHKLKGYGEKRNDPNQDLASNLSPYLHFGQVSGWIAIHDGLPNLTPTTPSQKPSINV